MTQGRPFGDPGPQSGGGTFAVVSGVVGPDVPDACPKCGSTEGMMGWGWQYTAVSRHRRFKCKSCGTSCRGRKLERTDTQYV